MAKEAELNSALVQTEKMAALGRLVGAVAHEINNPLAGILGTSQIILEDPELIDPSMKEDIVEIRSAAVRSKRIIEDLLGFTSSEEKKPSLCDTKEIVQGAIAYAKSALRGIEVNQKFQEELPNIIVQPHLLQQILFNLITNAAHAMNGSGRIDIQADSNENQVRIIVSDRGPGISSDRLGRIFDPFLSTKREGTGTGLGLSIVRNLANRINARINVFSTLGKGTEFHIFLPVPSEGLNG